MKRLPQFVANRHSPQTPTEAVEPAHALLVEVHEDLQQQLVVQTRQPIVTEIELCETDTTVVATTATAGNHTAATATADADAGVAPRRRCQVASRVGRRTRFEEQRALSRQQLTVVVVGRSHEVVIVNSRSRR